VETSFFKILPPLLRGCTFDGEKGSVVVSFDVKGGLQKNTEKSADQVLSLPELELPKDAEKVISLYDEWKRKYNRHPSVATFGDSEIFGIGNTYDQAVQRVNSFKASEILSPDISNSSAKTTYSRNQVVDGKICVVTGGAQGFGAEITKNLVSMGALVFVADLNIEGADSFCRGLNKEYDKTAALPVNVDVSSEDSVRAMIGEIVEKAGGIDLFISNAGVLKAGSVKEITLKDFSFVTMVNYAGFFICTKHASQVMAWQNRVRKNYFTDIIQINSKSGLQGSNKNGAYAGGKFGGIGLVQSFAMELVADNIKVNAVCPGNFFEGPLWSDPVKGLFVQYLNAGKVPGAETIDDVRDFYEKKVPMGRGCNGRDVAKAIYYIIEQKYETGQAVPVTGGQVMLK